MERLEKMRRNGSPAARPRRKRLTARRSV